MRATVLVLMSTALAVGLSAGFAGGADHVDGPRASEDPAADITDVFAWMSPDAQRLNLVMGLTRNAAEGSRFSDAVEYTFHTTSRPAFGQPAVDETDIVCTFDTAQNIECRIDGVPVVAGDASDPAGIRSPDGTVRAFAGLRNDAFFFNASGFLEVGGAVAGAADSLSFDEAGCPQLDQATANSLVEQLRTEPGGGPARDDFGGLNVLAIVLSVDRSLVTEGGPIIAVWGGTTRR